MKPEWGAKHECPGCGAHFYDMRKPDARCPKCNTPANDKAALLAKTAKASTYTAPKKQKDPLDELDDFDDLDTDLEDMEGDDDFLEDADDLVGDDENDMSEIMEHVDEEGPERSL